MLFSKRNKTIDTQHKHRIEPVSKLSYIFHKLTHTIKPTHRHALKKPSIPQLGSIFKSDSQLQTFDKDSGYTKDMTFERRRYQQNMQLKDDGYATLSQRKHPEQNNLYRPSLIGSQVPSINHNNKNNNVPSILIKRPSLATTTTSFSLDGSSIYQIRKHNSTGSSRKSINSKHISINNTRTSSHSSDLHENGKSNASMKESPNLTTHSGDLTARQFANIAGIKILSENDDNADDELDNFGWEDDGNNSTGMDGQITTLSNISKGALLDQDKLSAGTSSSILTLNYSTTSNGSSSHKQPQPQIWDSAFWNDNSMESINYSKTLPQRKLSAPTDRRQHYYQLQQSHSSQQQQQQMQLQHRQLKQQQCQQSSDTTILHDLRRINTISNDQLIHERHQQFHRQIPLRRNQSYVIKKGRFEVSIETSSDTTEMDISPLQHL